MCIDVRDIVFTNDFSFHHSTSTDRLICVEAAINEFASARISRSICRVSAGLAATLCYIWMRIKMARIRKRSRKTYVSERLLLRLTFSTFEIRMFWLLVQIAKTGNWKTKFCENVLRLFFSCAAPVVIIALKSRTERRIRNIVGKK